MNNKEGFFYKIEPNQQQKMSFSVIYKYKEHNFLFNMIEKIICKKCGIEKTIDNFSSTRGNVYHTCKPCQSFQRQNYDDGIHADLSKLAPHSRTAVLDARDMLTRMGYDVELPIYEQFRERMLLKWGVDMDDLGKSA